MIATRSQIASTSGRMCVEKNTVLPSSRSSQDEVADLLAADRIEAAHRLVEHHQLGIVHQRLREPDPLQHALGELAQRPVGARGPRPDPLEQLAARAARRSARGRPNSAPDEVEQLLARVR